MLRQRILERCGWNFWRIRGSEYYYNPDIALTSLWKTLEYHKIEPLVLDMKLEGNQTTNIENGFTNLSHNVDMSQNETTVTNAKSDENYNKPEKKKTSKTKIKEKRKKIEDKEKNENVEAKFLQMGFFEEDLEGFYQQISLYDDESLSSELQATAKKRKNRMQDLIFQVV